MFFLIVLALWQDSGFICVACYSSDSLNTSRDSLEGTLGIPSDGQHSKVGDKFQTLNSERSDNIQQTRTRENSRSRSPEAHRQISTCNGTDSCRKLPDAPGLVGLGIAFPEHHLEPDGDVDIRVSFVRHYMEHATRQLRLPSDLLHFQNSNLLV